MTSASKQSSTFWDNRLQGIQHLTPFWWVCWILCCARTILYLTKLFIARFLALRWMHVAPLPTPTSFWGGGRRHTCTHRSCFRGMSKDGRFIEDVLFFWAGPKDTCQRFLRTFNNNDLWISLTSTLSLEMVDFLDLKVRFHDGKITTCLLRKDHWQPVTFNSFHLNHLKRGIPKGQFLRLRRNCLDDKDFREAAADLMERFLTREYPRKVISGAFEIARHSRREDLLIPNPV